jgi:hypothetical protein
MDGQGVPDAPGVAARAVAPAPAGAVNLRARADRPPQGDFALAARLQQKEFLRAQPKRRGTSELEEQEVAHGGGRAGLLEFLGLWTGATVKAIRATISTNNRHGRPSIHRALAEGKGVGLVRGLLDEGGAEQLRAKDSNGLLPIHYAAEFSSVEVVALLLERGGAEPLRAEDRSGWLPIHSAAAFSDSAEVVALLVRSGLWQLAAKNPDGRTPLALAKHNRRPEAIRALLRVRVGSWTILGRWDKFWDDGTNSGSTL